MFINAHTHKLGKGDIVIFNKYPLDEFPEVAENVLFSCGIHPWFIKDTNLEQSFDAIRIHCERNQIIAIGECGLDKYIENMPLQEEVFIKHIQISEQYKLPLIIHSVKSHHLILEIRKKSKAKQSWIIHGFNGSTETAQQFIKQNIFLSLGPNLFKNRDKVFKLLNTIDMNYVLFETDDTDIDIRKIYFDATCILNKSESEIEHQIMSNFKRIFN